MSNFNKLFLALAFLGGSAAAQAGDARLDLMRLEWGRDDARSTGADGWAGGMDRSQARRDAKSDYTPEVYERLSGTYNGRLVSRGLLLGRYDVKRAPLENDLASSSAPHYLS